MLEKTINEVISKKINHWLKSIDDETLVEELKNNIIVTGGAIVSLIQNEEPNDYDVYFKTKETTLKVAEYYCKKFNERTKSDNKAEVEIEEVEDQPTRVKVFIKSSGVAEEGKEAPFNSYEHALDKLDDTMPIKTKDKKDKETNKGDLYHPIFLTSNAISLSEDIQLIIRFYGSPEEIHQNYDFIHTKGYWTSWEEKVHITSEVYEAVINKRLRYVGSLYPICSLFRLRKFINRGWNISAGEILKIAWQVNDLNLNSIEVLEDQLLGVDTLYFADLVAQMREEQEKNKDFKITNSYVISLVDKIFN